MVEKSNNFGIEIGPKSVLDFFIEIKRRRGPPATILKIGTPPNISTWSAPIGR